MSLCRRRKRSAHGAGLFAALSAVVAFGAASVGLVGSSAADVSEVTGSAYGHYTNVSLFGGPSSAKGPVPKVTLPAGGADPALTAKVPSATAVYGPATIFGGKWPIDVDIAPPSGPITVSTRGTTGPGGSVTSTVDITLREPANPKSPGGFGPTVPNEGDELHSTCTANENGASGSVRIVNGILATSTDSSGEPKDTEPIPEYPPVNYTRTGVITNVGDRWKIVYNEQTTDANGTLTVIGIHMYLLGDIAVGEQIVGLVQCGVKHVAGSSTPAPTSAGGSAPSEPGAASTVPGAASTVPGAMSTDSGSVTAPTKGAAGAKTTPTTKPTAGAAGAAAPPSSDTTLPVTDTSVPPETGRAYDTASPMAPESSAESLAGSKIAAESKDSGVGPLPFLVVGVVLAAGGVVVVPRFRRRRLAGGEHSQDGTG